MADALQNYIDGTFVDAADGTGFDVFNPATGEVIATAADSKQADVEAAVNAARRTFDDGPWWPRTTERERGGILLRAADIVRREHERRRKCRDGRLRSYGRRQPERRDRQCRSAQADGKGNSSTRRATARRRSAPLHAMARRVARPRAPRPGDARNPGLPRSRRRAYRRRVQQA
jgi:hypothetical protein